MDELIVEHETKLETMQKQLKAALGGPLVGSKSLGKRRSWRGGWEKRGGGDGVDC